MTVSFTDVKCVFDKFDLCEPLGNHCHHQDNKHTTVKIINIPHHHKMLCVLSGFASGFDGSLLPEFTVKVSRGPRQREPLPGERTHRRSLKTSAHCKATLHLPFWREE